MAHDEHLDGAEESTSDEPGRQRVDVLLGQVLAGPVTDPEQPASQEADLCEVQTIGGGDDITN